jgi:hypothetical protein
LSGLSVLLGLRLLLLRRLGLALSLLSGLRVLLRLRLLLLSWLGLFFWRLALAFLLLRGQYTDRPDNQKQGDGAGRSNELHFLVSVKVTIE